MVGESEEEEDEDQEYNEDEGEDSKVYSKLRDDFDNPIKVLTMREEVLTMREAMNDFHKSINNTTPLPANIIVMPPYEHSHSQSSANVTNNSKVSQITTRRTEKNKYN